MKWNISTNAEKNPSPSLVTASFGRVMPGCSLSPANTFYGADNTILPFRPFRGVLGCFPVFDAARCTRRVRRCSESTHESVWKRFNSGEHRKLPLSGSRQMAHQSKYYLLPRYWPSSCANRGTNGVGQFSYTFTHTATQPGDLFTFPPEVASLQRYRCGLLCLCLGMPGMQRCSGSWLLARDTLWQSLWRG